MDSEPVTDTLRETLAVFDGAGEPWTTPEVAERLDLGRRSTYARLERLVERNLLETKKVGANARVWWLSPSSADPPNPDRSAGVPSLVDGDGLLEAAPVTVAVFRADGSTEWLNSQARRQLGLDDASISDIGLEDIDSYDSDGNPIPAADHPLWHVVETGESISDWVVQHDSPAGDRRWVSLTVTPQFDDEGDVERVVVAGKDVTDLKRKERQLEQQRDELQAELDEIFERITDGFYLLDEDLRFLYLNDHARTTLGLDGDPIGEDIRDLVTFTDQFERALHEAHETHQPIVFEDYYDPVDRWYYNALYPSESGLSVYFRDITERKQREHKIEQQREQLAALNSLHEIVREISDAVIEQSTRSEIEMTVCERLADSESYLFAWIGDVDTATQTVNLRCEAGVEGYLDGITISVDPDDDRSEGPTGRAFRTGEIQTTQDLDADPRHDPWRAHIEPYGFRSSAAIPIVHEETIYGTLNVYAERPNAFEGQEGEVIAQVGEIIGHAIAAVERKHALMSDDLIELEFRVSEFFATFDDRAECDGTVSLDHVIQVAADEFLVYGSATADAANTVADLVEVIPYWESITFTTEDDPAGFELRLTEPPILTTITSLGGYVDQAVIADDTYRLTIHIAPSVDVRRVLEVVKRTYPRADLTRRQQITRPRDDPRHIQRRLLADLTDRQFAALDAAYHAGFFEWPRERTGEEVAESLDVAPPTFHQHLRKAERKVLDTVFSAPRHRTD